MKPDITFILPAESKLLEAERHGLLPRWKYFFEIYAKYFNIEVYSCDFNNYSKKISVKHRSMVYFPEIIKFQKQIFYNIYLFFKCWKMGKILRIISCGYFIVPFLKYLFGKKIIVSYHYNYKDTVKKEFKGIKALTAGLREKLSIKFADLIITTTEDLKRIIKDRYGKNSVVIPNFVDINMFYPRKKENYILYAGRVTYYKGIVCLLQAFKKVTSLENSIKLVITGNGEVEYFKKFSEEENIKNVEFTGPLDYRYIAELMGHAGIFVLPSLYSEGNPKALIEAMACGCACIVSDVSGNRELIRNLENGLVFKSGDSDSLAECIMILLKNNELKKQIGANARISVKSNSIENTILKEIQIIKEFLKYEKS